jgi:hypothetical protein
VTWKHAARFAIGFALQNFGGGNEFVRLPLDDQSPKW